MTDWENYVRAIVNHGGGQAMGGVERWRWWSGGQALCSPRSPLSYGRLN